MKYIFICLLIVFASLSPRVVQADCIPGESCGSCTSQSCSDGNACATGHTYCVWDPNGNYCGSCSTEINNCSTQCSSGGGGSGTTTYYDCGTYQGILYQCTDSACTQGCITIRPTENNCTIRTDICSQSSPGPCPTGQTGTVTCNTGTGNCETNCTTSSTNPNPASTLKGFHDSSSCTESNGWACDPNNYTQPLQIHFYKDGRYGAGGTFIGSTLANLQREQGVGDQCGGNRNHGFSFVTPNSLKDSQSHSIYAYAISAIGADALLTSTPKTITCSCPTVGSTSTLSPSGRIPAGTHSLTWTDVSNATMYNVRVDDLINSWDCTANPTDLCRNNVTSGSVSYNFQAGRSYSFWIDAYNSCGSVSYIDTTVTVTPNCNATPVCSGACNAAENICPSSSGTRNGCVYTTYSGAGSCTQTTAPDQPCTKTYTCSSGNVCVSGRCLTNYEPWIQTTGGDVHSNTGINTPGGP